MLFCVMCVIVCDVLLYCILWYYTALYCHVLHCSTLPPGINHLIIKIIVVIIFLKIVNKYTDIHFPWWENPTQEKKYRSYVG
jgi:hypothetical protein